MTWHKRLEEAVKRLERSGLWPELKEKYSNCLLMTEEDHTGMKELYWKQYGSDRRQMNTLWAPYAEKYPFMFRKEGKRTVPDTDYLWEMSDCMMKKPSFGTETKRILAELNRAITDKTPYTASAPGNGSMTATVAYDPDTGFCEYMEERPMSVTFRRMLDGECSVYEECAI